MTFVDRRVHQPTGDVETREWPSDGNGGVDLDGMINDWDDSLRPLTDPEKDRATAFAERQSRAANSAKLDASISTLRGWAADGATTIVTAQNNDAVTQTMAVRLGLFFEHFADLLESDKL
jgi:hypothetical protein